MSKHTPGPWHVGATAKTIIYAQDGFAVANATVFHGRFTEGETEAVANAALIAAAPDLSDSYGKLHDMISDMIESGRLKESDIPDDYAALVNQLAGPCNAAIAKARGE